MTSPNDVYAVLKQMRDALQKYHDDENPFITDDECCECGESGDGRDRKGNVCAHIQGVRAMNAFTAVLGKQMREYEETLK